MRNRLSGDKRVLGFLKIPYTDFEYILQVPNCGLSLFYKGILIEALTNLLNGDLIKYHFEIFTVSDGCCFNFFKSFNCENLCLLTTTGYK